MQLETNLMRLFDRRLAELDEAGAKRVLAYVQARVEAKLGKIERNGQTTIPAGTWNDDG